MKRYAVFFFLVLSCKGFCQNTYFQQEVNYQIAVRLDDARHELFATEKINYTNNSPQVLKELFFHLWPNAYKNKETAFAQQLLQQGNTNFYFSDSTQKGFIDQLDFKVNDQPVKWTLDSMHIDICRIVLNQALQLGEKISITTPFHVKIPDSRFSRLGHEGQSYQITQWYPKPAVYDASGWHAMPYLHQGEFYSEYGSFDVTITLPENYVLAATGDRIDAKEELSFLEKKIQETQLISHYSKDLSFPASSKQMKNIHFHQDKIHDFAWFADKRFHVMKHSVQLQDSTHKVDTWTFYGNSNPRLWMNAINYVGKAVTAYSSYVGEYPYKNATAVEGALSAGGGMEYPNITVIGPVVNARELEIVITHEVGHNWFYGILGSNERTHPWMDEGINTYYEIRYMEEQYTGKKNGASYLNPMLDRFLGLSSLSHRQVHVFSYLFNARREFDQALNLPAPAFTTLNYGGMVYAKTGLSLQYLQSYLGRNLFDSCMKNYFNAWKFKHPQPADFQKIIASTTTKNTEWFFSDLLTSTKKIDYKIQSVQISPKDASFQVKIKNRGALPGPFPLAGQNKDSTFKLLWFEGFKESKTLAFPAGTYEVFEIDPHGDLPLCWRKNSKIRNRGLLKKQAALQFKLLAGIEQPDRTQIFYTPVIGFNNYDKIMLGMAFYNSLLPSKKPEYVVVPMYALGTNSLSCTGNINYNVYTQEGFFQHIQAGVSAMQYHFKAAPLLAFRKIAPFLNLTFHNKDALSHSTQKISMRLVNLNQDQVIYDLSTSLHTKSVQNIWSYFQEVVYEIKNTFCLHPSQFTLNVQHGKGFLKTSAEENYNILYKGTNRSFNLRFFGGLFAYNSSGSVPFRTAGWSGSEDYLYDGVFIGRSENAGLLAQQMLVKEGGFKVPTFLGRSSTWLTSLNLNSSLPGRLPLRAFIDLGLSPGQGFGTNPDGVQLLYDAGIQLTLIPDIVVIYFPIFMSDEIKRVLDLNGITRAQTIRFEFNIQKLNPFAYIRNLH